MSFSSEAKRQMCDVGPLNYNRAKNELSSMLSFSNAQVKEAVLLQTKHKAIALRLQAHLQHICHNRGELVKMEGACAKEQRLFQVRMDYQMQRENLLENCSLLSLTQDSARVADSSFQADVLRGAFLVCGSVSDPNKEYHLEFLTTNSASKSCLTKVFQSLELPVRYVRRGNGCLFYFKESETIEDLLTLMGACKASLSIMNIKIMKDLRNKVNRVTNCETANIGKTVAASMRQVDDIKWIAKTKGLHSLPDNLEQLARIRLEYPELSLEELSKKLRPPLSRSGVYHRLQRLSEIAQECRENQKKEL